MFLQIIFHHRSHIKVIINHAIFFLLFFITFISNKIDDLSVFILQYVEQKSAFLVNFSTSINKIWREWTSKATQKQLTVNYFVVFKIMIMMEAIIITWRLSIAIFITVYKMTFYKCKFLMKVARRCSFLCDGWSRPRHLSYVCAIIECMSHYRLDLTLIFLCKVKVSFWYWTRNEWRRVVFFLQAS